MLASRSPDSILTCSITLTLRFQAGALSLAEQSAVTIETTGGNRGTSVFYTVLFRLLRSRRLLGAGVNRAVLSLTARTPNGNNEAY